MKKSLKQLLFLEDEDFLREKTTEVLNLFFLKNIVKAKTADEALELFKSIDFDVLICDIKTPGNLNGLEFIQKAKEINPFVKSIVLTGFSHDEFKMQAANIGVDKYIIKPIGVDTILKEIEILSQ